MLVGIRVVCIGVVWDRMGGGWGCRGEILVRIRIRVTLMY